MHPGRQARSSPRQAEGLADPASGATLVKDDVDDRSDSIHEMESLRPAFRRLGQVVIHEY
jgi:hypothetical protein